MTATETALEIQRVEIPAPGQDPLSWLHAQRDPAKLYWRDRDGRHEVAATGCAEIIQGPDADIRGLMGKLSARLAVAEGDARYYGGFRFSEGRAIDLLWRPFRGYRFVLPRVELVRRGGKTFFAVHVLPGESADEFLSKAAGSHSTAGVNIAKLPAPTRRRDYPSRDGWRSKVLDVLGEIRSGALAKLVLARKSCFDFGTALDPVTLLQRVCEASPDCFHFCFSPEGRSSFIGASPERLFHRKGRDIRTEAVAGTRPRGLTLDSDARLASELAASAKDIAEHRCVVESIRDVLGPLCEKLSVDDTAGLLKLPTIQHLVSGIRGGLRPGVTDADILARLHPTPAVGGHPTARAVEDIARLEPFDRGWYAAPVGWVGRDEAEFAVAIRCGLVAGQQLCLYSGAGIVEGSTPDGEWDEIESKIGHFINLLTGP